MTALPGPKPAYAHHQLQRTRARVAKALALQTRKLRARARQSKCAGVQQGACHQSGYRARIVLAACVAVLFAGGPHGSLAVSMAQRCTGAGQCTQGICKDQLCVAAPTAAHNAAALTQQIAEPRQFRSRRGAHGAPATSTRWGRGARNTCARGSCRQSIAVATTAQPPCSMLQHFHEEITGYDDSNQITEVTSPVVTDKAGCAAVCLSETTCVAFNFFRSGQGAVACSLKKAVASTLQETSASGVGWHSKYLYYTRRLSSCPGPVNVAAQNAAATAAAATAATATAAATMSRGADGAPATSTRWGRGARNTCARGSCRQSIAVATTAQPPVCSMLQHFHEEITGYDDSNQITEVTSPVVTDKAGCAAVCLSETTCVAFNFFRSGQGAVACSLKKAVASTLQETSASGVGWHSKYLYYTRRLSSCPGPVNVAAQNAATAAAATTMTTTISTTATSTTTSTTTITTTPTTPDTSTTTSTTTITTWVFANAAEFCLRACVGGLVDARRSCPVRGLV